MKNYRYITLALSMALSLACSTSKAELPRIFTLPLGESLHVVNFKVGDVLRLEPSYLSDAAGTQSVSYVCFISNDSGVPVESMLTGNLAAGPSAAVESHKEFKDIKISSHTSSSGAGFPDGGLMFQLKGITNQLQRPANKKVEVYGEYTITNVVHGDIADYITCIM